ncbi:uncharacterized protein METZ01_LOCUS25238 [marine metagenome]|uniref:Uncharacterized protein n=1 Tax=marine metagenome TaxID=408172 RepID=A0A381Q0H9_9ZZZZ
MSSRTFPKRGVESVIRGSWLPEAR